MIKFIKVPDGIIRADLIKRVSKYEYNTYEGNKLYVVKIEEEIEHKYEKEFSRSSSNDNALEWRDKVYDNIIEQLIESREEDAIHTQEKA